MFSLASFVRTIIACESLVTITFNLGLSSSPSPITTGWFCMKSGYFVRKLHVAPRTMTTIEDIRKGNNDNRN